MCINGKSHRSNNDSNSYFLNLQLHQCQNLIYVSMVSMVFLHGNYEMLLLVNFEFLAIQLIKKYKFDLIDNSV